VLRQQSREDEILLIFGAEIKNVKSYNSAPPYAIKQEKFRI
jgi:hypothetical protein